MRPIRSTSSERIRLSRITPSAQLGALDVQVARLSPAKVKGGLHAVDSEELERRESHGKQVAGARFRGKLLPGNNGYHSEGRGLVTTKEEVDCISEQLTVLKRRPAERIERRHMTADELQKLLYSTDVAKILLDIELNIRFFTPATKLIFNVTPGDIGRSLEELSSLAPDGTLMNDARKVLQTFEPIEREIEARSGAWYLRRILPYRNEGQRIEGIVVTYADITHQKEATAALEYARMQADSANVAKSRFLAAASHDLRQPLQTLVLLQELLAKVVVGEKAQKLVARFDQTLGGMSGMLNALLDINQIEAGTVRAEFETFRIDALLERVTADLAYQAEAQRIALHVLPCKLSVYSDPRLLEQMIRNLVSNALKYTKRGRVLVGCRRRSGNLCIEIWDTGVGIPAGQLQEIFVEYHQLANSARDRSLGLGLGLSIVKRLGILLDHPVTVRSQFGKGSVFSIEVRQSLGGAPARAQSEVNRGKHHHPGRTRTVLIVEDDSEVRDLLEIGLSAEGHQVVTANDGVEALNLTERDAFQPDLVISDFNLPNGMDGLCVAGKLRGRLRRSVPVIILTGDISTKTLRDIAVQECEHLNKPASLKELVAAIERLVPAPGFAERAPVASVGAGASVIYVVDDDGDVRHAIRSMLEYDGNLVEDFEDGESFLNSYRPGRNACLLLDANLPGINGLDLLKKLKSVGDPVPAIMITGQSDVPMAVEAMKAGAADFLEKPIRGNELLAGVGRALESSHDSGKLTEWRKDAADHLARLTHRQRQIMELVLAGHPSKNIATDLGISQRTVENHRASIMKKAGVRSLPALARLALAAAGALVIDQSRTVAV
jgi:two-component system, chemotaxis family, CheB/CheR fusion protein